MNTVLYGADNLLAQTRVTYQWARFEELDQWWHWALVGCVSLFVLSYVLLWYRRDAVEQQRPVGWALMLLRIAALAGILLYFFQFDRRTEQRVVRDSRVAVLVDTSLSMTLPSQPSNSGLVSNSTRAEEVAKLFGQSDFLQQLASQHELTVYRFDQTARPTPVAAIAKSDATALAVEVRDMDAEALAVGRQFMYLALGLGGFAMLLVVASLVRQMFGAKNSVTGGWMLLVGSVLSLVALILAARAIVPTTRYPLAAVFGADLPPLSEVEQDRKASDKLESDPLKKLSLPFLLIKKACFGTQNRVTGL